MSSLSSCIGYSNVLYLIEESKKYAEFGPTDYRRQFRNHK